MAAGVSREVAAANELFEGELEVSERLDWNGLCLSFAVARKRRDGAGDANQVLLLLPVDGESSPGRLAAFETEMPALARLDHSNVLAVRTWGVRHGVPFLTYDAHAGRTLAAELAHGPIGRRRALSIVLDVLEGLRSAHLDGIRHFDLTPANVIVGRDAAGSERTRIAAMGLAPIVRRARRDDGTGPTGKASGTDGTRYLAPELLAGDLADGRADLYSAGVLLYRMLTDEPPPPRPPVLAPFHGNLHVPADVEPILLRALAVDPLERYPSVDEMLDDVRAVLDGRPLAPSQPVRAAATPARELPRWVLPGAGALLFGVVALATILVLGGSPEAVVTQEARAVARAAPAAEPAPGVAPVEAPPSRPAAVSRSGTGSAQPSDGESVPGDAARSSGEAQAPIVFRDELVPAREDDLLAHVPRDLAVHRDRVRSGEPLDAEAFAPMYGYARSHRDDARIHLVLAEGYMLLGWFTDAIDRYLTAYRVDSAMKRHRAMLDDLIVLVFERQVSLDAADAIVAIYGRDAMPAVDAAIASDPPPDRLRALEQLRARLD
jgi:serine/threonine-protein kinase